MKPITSAIVISLAASGSAAAAAANYKKKQLRGANANQQHRSLEGECTGVPNGEWRPTPGCHGAALCMNGEEFFLYPCNEEEGFLYDEARGGCAPKAEVKCSIGWDSIGVQAVEIGDVTDGETVDADADVGDADGQENTIEDSEEVTGDNADVADKKEKRICNTLQEKTYFKACKKTHCVGLRDELLEECKEKCREQECTDESEDEKDGVEDETD
jgi:hypothetical protein